MKKILKNTKALAWATFLTASVLYASSNTIAYQGVAFNTGAEVASTQIAARFTIFQSDGTTQVFDENVSNITTTDKGFFSHKIGSVQTVAYNGITWADNYKLQVSVDYANGTNFTSLGMQELTSTPYALKAKTADSATTATTATNATTAVTTSGNAATATKLETSRTIGGVSFDGSANIDLPGVNARGNQDTTGTAFNVYVEEDVNSNETRYLPFLDFAASGNRRLNVDTGLKYNPFSNTLYATSFSGTATSATTCANYLPLAGGTMTGRLTVNAATAYYQTQDYRYMEQGATNYGTGDNLSISIAANGGIVGKIIYASELVTVSDKRVKTDIKPIQDALETIAKLRPVSYTKIDKMEYGGRLEHGFIAQEVKEIIPSAIHIKDGFIPVLKDITKVVLENGVKYKIQVSKDNKITREEYIAGEPLPDGDIYIISKEVNDFQTIEYDVLFTHAIKAIQEQQKEIEQQNTKIQTLQNEITQIKNALKNSGIK